MGEHQLSKEGFRCKSGIGLCNAINFGNMIDSEGRCMRALLFFDLI